MAVKEPVLVPGRHCGDCGLCCKLLAVEELHKPARQWCPAFKAGRGCSIHGRHPVECRSFHCLWRLQAALGDAWQPSRARFVLYFTGDGDRLVIDVDPGFPAAWQARPYADTIRSWADDGRGRGLRVTVKVGAEITDL